MTREIYKNKLFNIFKISKEQIEEEFSPYFYTYFKYFFEEPIRFNFYYKTWSDVVNVTQMRNKLVLDCGCGFGIISIIFYIEGARKVIASDHNFEKIEVLNKLLTKIGITHDMIEPHIADGLKLPYKDSSIDRVFINAVLSHIKNIELFLKEIRRVLKQNGIFYCSEDDNSLYLPNIIHSRKIQKMWEYGKIPKEKFRATDIKLPFVQIRKNIIKEAYPQLDNKTINKLALKTKGLVKEEIIEFVKKNINQLQTINPKPRTTRNPITGEYTEKEISPFYIKKILKQLNFTIKFLPPTFYPQYIGYRGKIKKFLEVLFNKYSTLSFLFVPYFRILCIKR